MRTTPVEWLGLVTMISLIAVGLLAASRPRTSEHNPSRCQADVIAERGDTTFIQLTCVKR